ncbi:MAG: OsmC family protein [Armatimonadota bacterium]|nr:OsmC family protein [bacterium]
MADLTIAVEAKSCSKTRTDVSVRDLVFSIDEPEKLGGTNTGPNPIEYVLGALAGCINVVGHIVAKEMGFDISSMKLHLEGNLDPLGYMGRKTGVRPGFKEIRVSIDIESTASADVLQEWARAIEARCPVSDNLGQMTPINISL